MRAGLSGILGIMMLTGIPSAAATETPFACKEAATMSKQWDREDYLSPQKPNQLWVPGRNGHETSGPGYRSMRMSMRMTAEKCRNEEIAASQAPAEAVGSGSSTPPNNNPFGHSGAGGSGGSGMKR
jgi:hypothetical protein